MKIPVNFRAIRQLQVELGYTQEEIADLSGGILQLWQIKYLLSGRTKSLCSEQIEILAQILECEAEDFVDVKFARELDVPYDLLAPIKDLYYKNTKDIQPYFERVFDCYKQDIGYQNLISQGAMLYEALTRPNINDPRERIWLARRGILEECQLGQARFSVLLDPAQQCIPTLIARISEEKSPSAQLTVLVFTYLLKVFDAVFLEELVISACQDSLSRIVKNGSVEQLHHISRELEILTCQFFNWAVHMSKSVDMTQFELYGFENKFFELAMTLVIALDRQRQHLDDPMFASQCINRPVFDGIKNKVKILSFEMKIPAHFLAAQDFWNSRFGERYKSFRNIMPKKNQSNWQNMKQESFSNGYITRMYHMFGTAENR